MSVATNWISYWPGKTRKSDLLPHLVRIIELGEGIYSMHYRNLLTANHRQTRIGIYKTGGF